MRKFLWLFLLVAAVAGGWMLMHGAAQPVLNSSPGSGPIIAFGDSLTYGTGAGPEQSYPADLGKLLGRPVINAGAPGNTIAEAHERMQRDVLSAKPAVVIVLLGGNDYLRQKNLDDSFAELERIVRELQAQGCMVALVGMEGMIPLSGYGKHFAAIATHTRALYIPDILGGILGQPNLMSDYLHPNAKGYSIIAERVAKVLQPYIQKQGL